MRAFLLQSQLKDKEYRNPILLRFIQLQNEAPLVLDIWIQNHRENYNRCKQQGRKTYSRNQKDRNIQSQLFLEYILKWKFESKGDLNPNDIY